MILVLEATVQREFATISGYSLIEGIGFVSPDMIGPRAEPKVSVHIESHAPFVAISFNV
ncbi:hypothetical protein [Paraburkholderia dioscoreae]|uniref:Uncharacterized protein n=1 Tax=Paraburkholderia dioscoreae TaxID=2604047 RepID=A0A5Q4ZI46_9BURK|nr:hypothetical protein [Paraburkholderia dioscoreae]VVD31016.1 conserved protein of unknown function [Paraburkholderia dioscoreae]